jgi:hypothetical protein
MPFFPAFARDEIDPHSHNGAFLFIIDPVRYQCVRTKAKHQTDRLAYRGAIDIEFGTVRKLVQHLVHSPFAMLECLEEFTHRGLQVLLIRVASLSQIVYEYPQFVGIFVLFG